MFFSPNITVYYSICGHHSTLQIQPLLLLLHLWSPFCIVDKTITFIIAPVVTISHCTFNHYFQYSPCSDHSTLQIQPLLLLFHLLSPFHILDTTIAFIIPPVVTIPHCRYIHYFYYFTCGHHFTLQIQPLLLLFYLWSPFHIVDTTITYHIYFIPIDSGF